VNATADTRRASTAAVEIRVELGSALKFLRDDVQLRTAQRALVAEVEALIRNLGLFGNADVVIAESDSPRPLRLWVNGRLHPYPPALARRAWLSGGSPKIGEYVARAEDPARNAYPTGWLELYLQDTGSSVDSALLFRFVHRLVQAAILERPGSLVRDEHVVAFAKATALSTITLDSILRGLLDLGVSVGDRDTIADVIREGEAIARPLEDTIEAAFARLRAHAVELHIHPETLSRLLKRSPTTGSFSVYAVHERIQRLFRDFEETFFAQFGFQLPDLIWVPSPAMPQGQLVIRVDAWWGLPVPLVLRGERVVEATPEELESTDILRVAVHPITGVRCAVVDDPSKERLEEHGLITRGPIDWVVLNLFADLSAHAARLFGIEDIEHQLARLKYQLVRLGDADGDPASELVVDGPYPELVDATLAHYSLGDLTRILRAMVDERLSLQNLPGILERLLRYDTVPQRSESLLVLDNRLPLAPGTQEDWRTAYAFLRRQLRSYLSYRFAWHENTVVAYLLEPELEASLVQGESSAQQENHSDDNGEAFRDAVWKELTFFGTAPSGQVILTTPTARATVRRLLETELPDLPVLAYGELRPDVNIQPIARILPTD
jgi:hypothetical protein